jgi:hypothetical protein
MIKRYTIMFISVNDIGGASGRKGGASFVSCP